MVLIFRLPLGVVLASPAMALTIVGHPHPTTMTAGAGLTFTSGVLPIDHVEFEHCDSSTQNIDVDASLDPVALDVFVVPPGTHCGATIVLAGAFELEGWSDGGGTFSLELDVGTISLDIDPALTIPPDGSTGGTELVLASAGWLDATSLGVDPGEHVVVDDGHPLHDALSAAIRNDSVLY